MGGWGVFIFLLVLWYICWIVQTFLAYGTAYRLTKQNGDNGVALCGWLMVFSLAAAVPGLGFYLWHKYKQPVQTQPIQGPYGNQGYGYNPQSNYAQPQQPAYPPAGGAGLCRGCGSALSGSQYCSGCGTAAY